MQGRLGALFIIAVVGLVIFRVVFMKKRLGIKAMYFGNIDKKDFLIPPFALFYFYMIFAHAFASAQAGRFLFDSESSAWIGVGLGVIGVFMMLWSIISFGRSFRVGIDIDKPGELITTGIFAYSRNPIYVAFGIILLAEFLIYPHWVLAVYLGAGVALLHRQVLREEIELRRIYGPAFSEYCARVRRYF